NSAACAAASASSAAAAAAEENGAGRRVGAGASRDIDFDVPAQVPCEIDAATEGGGVLAVQDGASVTVGDLNCFGAASGIPIENVKRDAMFQAVGEGEINRVAGAGIVTTGDAIGGRTAFQRRA